MKEIEFNLLDEPWIRVLLSDGKVREVGIRDALLHASDYVDLAGELQTQDVAVLRLLLAILYTVFSPVDEYGHHASFSNPALALICWKKLWDQHSFPAKPLEDYLDKWRDRFWLFHPRHPFWQIPKADMGAKYTEYGSAKLNGEISESGNKDSSRIFASYSGIGKTNLSYSQAVRWLLYINAYDDNSGKPKTKNDPTVTVGLGWLGKLDVIEAQGDNLFETLMLNLTLLKDGKEVWGPARPCWELDRPRTKERQEIALPDNLPELLTLQSRRLLLVRQDEKVTGYRLLGGDCFSPENAFSEQMTVWKKIENKNGLVTFEPKRHNQAIQFWREFPPVFAKDSGARQPGLVQWISKLMLGGYIDSHALINFRIVSVKYSGQQKSAIADIFGDTLTFHRQLLEDLGMPWRQTITDEIGRCESLAKQIGCLAEKLALAAGGDGKALSKHAKNQFYFRIDQPFRSWLYSIDPECGTEEKNRSQARWQKEAQQIARDLGEQMVRESGAAAFMGRSIKETRKGREKEEKKSHFSAPEAYNQFLYKIRKIYYVTV